MLSPPLLPLSPVWSHAAMGGARGCGVAVPSLSLDEMSRNLILLPGLCFLTSLRRAALVPGDISLGGQPGPGLGL